jgi:2,4-diaminopentanoate dehydrogenase
MSDKTYRVIQWMTGDVGQVGIRHFADNAVFDLVGLLVHSEDKVGMDAGEIAGIPPTGVVATDDIESMVAMDADCVFYTPVIMDVDTVCRLLRSGKNRTHSSPNQHFWAWASRSSRSRCTWSRRVSACASTT